MAPLQRRALYSLAIGLLLSVALIAVLAAQGDVTAFEREPNVRMVLYAVLIGVPLVYGVLVGVTLRRPPWIDERDRLVLDRSVKAQWVAVVISLAAWTVALTEVYHDTGLVPVAFLTLIFVSVLIVSPLAQSAGILLGYWRMGRDG